MSLSTPTESQLPPKRKRSSRKDRCSCGNLKMKASELCRKCSQATGNRPRKSPTGRLAWNERDKFGVIATLISTTGQVKVREGWGSPQNALTELVEWIDLQKEQWKIVSLSTPMTILTDLTRPRMANDSALPPEQSLLGRARRLDLLASEDDRLTRNL